MILKFDDKEIRIKEEYVKSQISNSTGRELNEFRFKIRVEGKEKFEEFQNMMNTFKEKYICQIDENGNVVSKYNVVFWNYRFYNEFDSKDINYLCEVEIMEREELFTPTLIIEGIECEVLKYKEEYDNYRKSIIINAVIKNTEEQRENIKKAINEKRYFNVVRPGINNSVLEMRFGKTIWSQHDGYIKRKIVLVEKKYDDNSKSIHALGWPEINNIMTMLSKNVCYTELLEKVLLDNNIINEENIKQMKEQVELDYKNMQRQFFLVDDVEDEF